MNIQAKVIEDSISKIDMRLTTLQLCYPRFIHSEFMTHRVFSRNASSSRAIPVAKMIEQVRSYPAMPLKFLKNKAGMQATEEYSEHTHKNIQQAWKDAANKAADIAEAMTSNYNIHKQFTNRILEPFQWIHVVVTATEWNNFFNLRIHPDAQPEIQVLASEMKKVIDKSIPCPCTDTEWHLPYVSSLERNTYPNEILCKLSAARCARVSYLTHDNQAPDPEKDIALYDKLIVMKPAHASPVEHQAVPDKYAKGKWANPTLHGNFCGWIQNRKWIRTA